MKRIKFAKLEVIFLLLLFFLPFERIPTSELMGFTIKISFILGILLIGLYLVKNYKALFKISKFSTSDIFLILLLISGAFSLFWAENIWRSATIWFLWMFVFLLYFITRDFVSSKRLKNLAEKIIIISAILVSFFGLFQFFGDFFSLPATVTGLRFQYTKAILGFPRIQSVALEPLYFSNFLIVPLFLSVKRYFAGKSFFNKYFFINILFIINIILGVSRGAYLGIAVALAIVITIIISSNDLRKKYFHKVGGLFLILLISAVVSLGLIYFFRGEGGVNNLATHLTLAQDGTEVSTSGRIDTYKEALRVFCQRPLGIGIGNWGETHIGTVDYSNSLSYGNVNNQYLEILVETGILGGIFFGLFLLFLFIEVIRSYKEKKDKLPLLIFSVAILALLVQYNFFSTLYIMYIWVFLGLLKSEVINS